MTNIALLIICLLLIETSGVLLVIAIVNPRNRISVENIVFGGGLGIGIASAIYFLALRFFSQSLLSFWWISEALLVVALVVLTIRSRASKATVDQATVQPISTEKPSSAVRFATFLGLPLVSLSFWSSWIAHPHADWDALMIWNLRARFLEREPIALPNVFSSLIYWSHPDYPLLLPTMCALGLKISGENPIAPALIAFSFFLLSPLLLLFALTRLKTRTRALTATLVLISTPLWVQNGASMLADVPIAFYFLATFVCVAFYERENKLSYLTLAAAFASLGAWTKNEGLLFILCVIIANTLVQKRISIDKAVVGRVLLGAAPIILLLFFFKLTLAPANDLIAGQDPSGGTLHRLLDPARLGIVLSHFAIYVVTFGSWLVSPVPLFALLWFMSGRPAVDLTGKRMFLTIALMLAGYVVIFQTTPANLQQHLTTAVDRLFLQLWPLCIFAFAYVFESKQNSEVAVSK